MKYSMDEIIECIENDLRLCLKLSKGEAIDDFDNIIADRIPRLRRVLREAKRAQKDRHKTPRP